MFKQMVNFVLLSTLVLFLQPQPAYILLDRSDFSAVPLITRSLSKSEMKTEWEKNQSEAEGNFCRAKEILMMKDL